MGGRGEHFRGKGISFVHNVGRRYGRGTNCNYTEHVMVLKMVLKMVPTESQRGPEAGNKTNLFRNFGQNSR